MVKMTFLENENCFQKKLKYLKERKSNHKKRIREYRVFYMIRVLLQSVFLSIIFCSSPHHSQIINYKLSDIFLTYCCIKDLNLIMINAFVPFIHN
jgi:uncharacterized membrane protein YgaE (UPF0421/DUF939 family)